MSQAAWSPASSTRSSNSIGPMILSLLVGATAGALLVALNMNKPDLERQRLAKALARCAKRGPGAVKEDLEGLMDDWKAATSKVENGLLRSLAVSVNELPG